MTTQTLLNTIAKLQAEQLAIVTAKNTDYAGNDAMRCFRACEELGVTSLEQGILVRMCDKLARVCNLIGSDSSAAVHDESVGDTLSDLANYANILQAHLLYRSGVVDDTENQNHSI